MIHLPAAQAQRAPVGCSSLYYCIRTDASIFDIIGRKVDEIRAFGQSETVTWGKNHNPGVYFIVPSEGKASAQKVILIK
ncbi:hypothetical protein CEE36_01595 [candidate division TA06 bacterium B3_TA06]|uniref:Secretion system C-terminal sorting domain-containing protein n=1 Tax=candidate division TA06 bacterium B3_TA06 TaxID=2012487 RepID=A0A532V9I8_UNCT6|nr:MAG: hypothetical protein CEE36_01595 [candidate division TA06 bacterium B3_TA06]